MREKHIRKKQSNHNQAKNGTELNEDCVNNQSFSKHEHFLEQTKHKITTTKKAKVPVKVFFFSCKSSDNHLVLVKKFHIANWVRYLDKTHIKKK